MEKQVNNSRYERKFLIENSYLTKQQIGGILLANVPLHNLYKERKVNNIYLDTPTFSDFTANVEGSEKRKKTRIRWYGNTFGKIEKPVLEIKTKAGLVGNKLTFPLPSFDLIDGFSRHNLMSILAQSNLPIHIKELSLISNLALLNSYNRQYFMTHDGLFRITLDTDLTYFRLNALSNHFLHKYQQPNAIVVEMKYDIKNELLANQITNLLPMRITKNSKYVTGIKYLHHSF